jgi:hypothetical protein
MATLLHAEKERRFMGVMLQAFYWDCPKAENQEHEWWTFIKSKLPGIAKARNRMIEAVRRSQVRQKSEKFLQQIAEEAQAVAKADEHFPMQRRGLVRR